VKGWGSRGFCVVASVEKSFVKRSFLDTIVVPV